MKCKYTYCKHGGIVEKEEALKIGVSYYHHDCYEEKLDKENIRKLIFELLPNEMIKQVNNVIKIWTQDKKIEIKYIIFTLEYIKINKCKLNYANGITYYLNNIEIMKEYDKIKIRKQYNMMKNDMATNASDNGVAFKYNNEVKKWSDII